MWVWCHKPFSICFRFTFGMCRALVRLDSWMFRSTPRNLVLCRTWFGLSSICERSHPYNKSTAWLHTHTHRNPFTMSGTTRACICVWLVMNSKYQASGWIYFFKFQIYFLPPDKTQHCQQYSQLQFLPKLHWCINLRRRKYSQWIIAPRKFVYED